MKKVLRKILALSLVFVFIGLCGVNAFAASYTDALVSGRYTINASYSINEKSTSGTVYLTDNGTLIPSSYLSASVTYGYQMMVGATLVPMSYTKTNTETDAYQATVSIRDLAILRMVFATYTFAADIPGSNGIQRCQMTTDTIYYP